MVGFKVEVQIRVVLGDGSDTNAYLSRVASGGSKLQQLLIAKQFRARSDTKNSSGRSFQGPKVELRQGVNWKGIFWRKNKHKN